MPLSPVRIQENVPLAPLTTLRIGGAARFFCRATTEGELLEAVAFARQRGLRLFILGGGSNLLVSDEGFPGLVLQVAFGGEPLIRREASMASYLVPAGFDWDVFVRATCEAGLSGVESLAGIPGMTGGTPVQNVGAYGQEVAQTIATVHGLNLDTMRFEQIPAARCGFGYRTSVFNGERRGRFVITQVDFRLAVGAQRTFDYPDLQRQFAGRTPTPLEVYEAVRAIRRAKGMMLLPGDATGADGDFRSAGSFFKNPAVAPERLEDVARAVQVNAAAVPHWQQPDGSVKLSAAWLIERSGFARGFSLGPVGVSSRHTLALINRTGTASCAELLRLASEVTARVEGVFGVRLGREPILLDDTAGISLGG